MKFSHNTTTTEQRHTRFGRFLVITVIGCVLLISVMAGRLLLAARDNWRNFEPPFRITTIDCYGLHTVTEQQIRAKLNLREGDKPPLTISPDQISPAMKVVRWLSPDKTVETQQEVVDRLEKLTGVARAAVSAIRNPDGSVGLFIGIEEKNHVAQFQYRPSPTGSVVLPDSMTEAYQQHMETLFSALTKTDPELDEDNSQGHALFTDTRMRALEEKMIAFDQGNLEVVRQVLNSSANAFQRTAAAWIIAYAPDKRLILRDLLEAVRDPDPEVRNNATRAIAIIADFASNNPNLGIHIDPSIFIEMLSSLTWTDRNKATGVLDGITKTYNAEALQMLRQKALPTLVEMARWKDVHALDVLKLLGRIGGMDDKEIQNAWDRGERERAIAMATSTRIPL